MTGNTQWARTARPYIHVDGRIEWPATLHALSSSQLAVKPSQPRMHNLDELSDRNKVVGDNLYARPRTRPILATALLYDAFGVKALAIMVW